MTPWSSVPSTSPHSPLVLDLAAVGLEALAQVGGKNAALGELIRALGQAGVRVPGGFSTTAAAYRLLLQSNGLVEPLQALLQSLNSDDLDALRQAGAAARALLLAAPLPPALEAAILAAYGAMDGPAGQAWVAVRSSATAEDLPEASFAGQQDTVLMVRGPQALLDACRRCYASLFTDRAIAYRQLHGFDQLQVALAIGVQRMVRSDLACSGVLFTLDTETGFRDAVLVTAAYGLGEAVVQGAVNPDEWLVFKPTLAQGYPAILSRRLGSKATRLVWSHGATLQPEAVPEAEAQRLALSDEEVLTLARWACQIEEHMGRRRGRPTPMDIEWAKDGLDRRPLHPPGPTGNGGIPPGRRRVTPLAPGSQRGRGALPWSGRGQQRGARHRAGAALRRPDRPVFPRRCVGDRPHRSRLGADPQAGQWGGDRPGGPHLPCGDHCARDGHHRHRWHRRRQPAPP